MPRDRPCLHQCNRRGCAPTKCLGRVEYSRDDPRYWVGRGLEPAAGKPFGWAHNMEREAIRAHLRRRIWRFGLDGLAAARLEFRITEIQRRLSREWPARWEAIKAGWRAARPPVQASPSTIFTRDELQHLVDLFAGANDPTSASIAAKAAARLTES